MEIFGREDTKSNFKTLKKKLYPTHLFILKVSKLLIIKFELAETITTTKRTFSKAKFKTPIQK